MGTTMHGGIACLVVPTLGIQHGTRLLGGCGAVEIDKGLSVPNGAFENRKVELDPCGIERGHDQAGAPT
jgi:hypothetical protein